MQEDETFKDPAAPCKEIEVQNPLQSLAPQALKIAFGVDGQMDHGANPADQHYLAGLTVQDAQHHMGGV